MSTVNDYQGAPQQRRSRYTDAASAGPAAPTSDATGHGMPPGKVARATTHRDRHRRQARPRQCAAWRSGVVGGLSGRAVTPAIRFRDDDARTDRTPAGQSSPTADTSAPVHDGATSGGAGAPAPQGPPRHRRSWSAADDDATRTDQTSAEGRRRCRTRRRLRATAQSWRSEVRRLGSGAPGHVADKRPRYADNGDASIDQTSAGQSTSEAAAPGRGAAD